MTRLSGPEPGYVATPVVLVAAALTLLEARPLYALGQLDRGSINLSRDVWPASLAGGRSVEAREEMTLARGELARACRPCVARPFFSAPVNFAPQALSRCRRESICEAPI